MAMRPKAQMAIWPEERIVILRIVFSQEVVTPKTCHVKNNVYTKCSPKGAVALRPRQSELEEVTRRLGWREQGANSTWRWQTADRGVSLFFNSQRFLLW